MNIYFINYEITNGTNISSDGKTSVNDAFINMIKYKYSAIQISNGSMLIKHDNTAKHILSILSDFREFKINNENNEKPQLKIFIITVDKDSIEYDNIDADISIWLTDSFN